MNSENNVVVDTIKSCLRRNNLFVRITGRKPKLTAKYGISATVNC